VLAIFNPRSSIFNPQSSILNPPHYPGMPVPPPVSVRLTTLSPDVCNYLPGRMATTRAFRTEQMAPAIYHKFMDAGFRRSGTIVYQPVCEGCRACVPIRVPVDRFAPSKSQRRSVKRNSDLVVTESVPELTDEKFDLYRRYVTGWHGKGSAEAADRRQLEEFLYRSPVRTIEFCYRTQEQKLIGVGICDVCDQSLSSVYFYFDPTESRRSLGTFSAVHEIDWCRQAGIPHLYLGFWVNGCETMQYKSQFRPAQILADDGIWRDLDD
jgi:arginine-tRNA-protein transferase